MPSTMKYTSLPTAVKLRVAMHPDVTKAWCGYNPNNYIIPVFLKGIYRDVYMGTITNLKASITEPWLQEFIEEDPEAFLGDAFRHVEVGEIFPEEYIDIDRADQPLGPKSGHHLNIITETDRTIEKWHIRISHNRDTYASFFKDYSTFKEFMDLLKGHMIKGIKKSLALIVKAVMTSDPSQVVFDDKDFARIFGRTRDNPTASVPASDSSVTVADSKLATKYNQMMYKILQKYSGKASLMWTNIKWYNPYHFSFDDYYEEMQKDFIFEEAMPGKDKAKRQMQQIYTDAHSTESLRSDNQKTYKVHHLHRNDCLFALFDAVNKALTVITTEESPEFWLGNDTASQAQQTKAAAERARAEIRSPVELDGHVVSSDQVGIDNAHATSASSDDGFEVTATKDDLIMLLNPEDYADLKAGVSRRGPMDVRSVNLDMLGVKKVYPFRSMKPGACRLIDKRAFKILSFFQMSDIQAPMEELTWRYKFFYQFAVVMFKNFAGCLFFPTPHFIASPQFYNKYGLIGQDVEKKK